MNAFRTLALAAVLAGTAAEAGAQGSCAINIGGTPELNGARQYWTNAAKQSGSADEKPKHLASGVRVLSSEKALRDKNQLGRSWLMSKLLFQWTQQPKQPMLTTRGQLGFTDNPTQQVDLLALMDTTMRAVETANPACRDSTAIYRRNLFNSSYAKGVEALNADQLDSATMLIRRALVIDPQNVNAFNALAIVAQKKDDQAGMIENYTKVIEFGGNDTAYARTVDLAVQNVAILKVTQAENLQGEAKTRTLREAETMFRNYLGKKPGDANAQQGLARVLSALGDTVAIQKIYVDMLGNRGNYSDIQFFEAGSSAIRAGQKKLGVQLMEAGLEKNPYFRDGLYNLAAVYFDEDNAEKLGPIARRLVELDPQNPDNWRLYAGQFQIRNAAAQKAKKPVPAGLQDSLLAYIKKFTDMKVQVAITQFTHAGAKHTLTGSVINGSDKPVNATLEVEFLDKDGQVVARKSAPVKAEPNASADFTIEATQTGVVAYRYKPIA
jgi:tetratricopeptide (TPR) repeat protein